jgi:prolipoprotein diacylglyceryl transferase
MGSDFEFTGFQGLASHGAAVGIIAGILIFARKTKSSFLWTMDMIVMVTALAGCFIRLGNLMNSEIYGNPTKSTHGFIFTHDLTRLLTEKYAGTVEFVDYEKISEKPEGPAESVPLQMNIHFSRKIKDERSINEFGRSVLPAELRKYNFDNNILPPVTDSMPNRISQENRLYVLSTRIDAVPRYPTQIYEAMSYLLIFFVLLLIYYRLDKRLREGFIFGWFLTLVFSARFIIEFVKQNQETFEDALTLNMGQILSIPFVAGGILLIILKWPGNEPNPS